DALPISRTNAADLGDDTGAGREDKRRDGRVDYARDGSGAACGVVAADSAADGADLKVGDVADSTREGYMTDEANVASATDTQAQPPTEPAAPELKSTDTGVLSAIKAQAETATPPPKVDKPEADKPASHANPADKGTSDADSAADHQDDDDRDDDDRKLEPWMKKRLKRAEERGRRQASAEILELIKSLGINPQQQAQQATAQPGQQVDNPGSSAPKTLADFDYDVEKYTAYQVQEAVKAALAERDAENERRKAEARAEAARQAFEKRKAEFEKRVGKGA